VGFRIQPLTVAQIRDFLTWVYDASYAVYNMAGDDPQEAVAFFSDPANGYFAIVAEVPATGPEFLGFCNFGEDARVPGGDYSKDAVDIGMGMRPDLTGRGRGATHAAAVFAFAQERYPEQTQRVTIAAFNGRAQRLCQKFGFRIVERFAHARDGRPFVIMMRPGTGP
jgi:ribosomal-protein-alanine N-acetyltransferase